MLKNDKTIEITRISKFSWFKVKIGETVIHFDPGYMGLYENQGIPETELEQKADIIFISHFHKDHLQPEMVEKISGPETTIVAPECCIDKIEHQITIVKPNDIFSIRELKVKVVDAYNTPEGHSTQKYHQKGEFVGYVLGIDGIAIYHAGDTDVIPQMYELGYVDIAFLPIGGTYVMDMDEAIEATSIIKPEIVIPMHEFENDPSLFRNKFNQSTTPHVVLLKVGEKVAI